jgi:hypothetical protein
MASPLAQPDQEKQDDPKKENDNEPVQWNIRWRALYNPLNLPCFSHAGVAAIGSGALGAFLHFLISKSLKGASPLVFGFGFGGAVLEWWHCNRKLERAHREFKTMANMQTYYADVMARKAEESRRQQQQQQQK